MKQNSILFVSVVYIFILLLPLHCNRNRYYQKIISHVPTTQSDLLASQAAKQYYNEHGDAIIDLTSFDGVIFGYDSEKNLKPLRQVMPVPELQSDTPQEESRPTPPDTKASQNESSSYVSAGANPILDQHYLEIENEKTSSLPDVRHSKRHHHHNRPSPASATATPPASYVAESRSPHH